MCPEMELLSQLVDRELDPEIERDVAQHLIACASCRNRVATLRSLHAFVGGLKRTHAMDSKCPEAAMLAAYVTEALSASERGSLEDHLSQCDSCLSEFAFLSQEVEDGTEGNDAPFAPDRARNILNRILSSQTNIITFKKQLRWAAAAAMFVVAAGVTAIVMWPSRVEPPPEIAQNPLPQTIALLPDYAEGVEEAVQVNYAEQWVPETAQVNRPAMGMSEQYSQKVVKVKSGYPVEMQRSYNSCQGPYQYFTGRTVVVRRSPELNRTQIWSPDFESYQPWQNQWWALPPRGFDDHFLFALPAHPVQVGESWAVVDKNNLRNALMKYAQCSIGRVNDVRALGTLREITPDGQAVIDLKVTFHSSQIRGARAAMKGTLYFDMNKKRMVRTVLKSDQVAIAGYRYPGGDPLPVNDPIALKLNITYRPKR